MKNVLVNVSFRDAYTKEVYEAGKTYPMKEERVAEVKEINPNLISVIGTVAPVQLDDGKTETKPKKKSSGNSKKKEDSGDDAGVETVDIDEFEKDPEE